MQVAVVPEEEALVLGNQADPGAYYGGYVGKVPTWISQKGRTYRLPRGRSLGFRIPSLILLKHVSQGDTSKLYGPEYMIGSSRASRNVNVLADLW